MLKIDSKKISKLLFEHSFFILVVGLFGLAVYLFYIFYSNFFVPVYLTSRLEKNVSQNINSIDQKQVNDIISGAEEKAKAEYTSTRNLFSF